MCSFVHFGLPVFGYAKNSVESLPNDFGLQNLMILIVPENKFPPKVRNPINNNHSLSFKKLWLAFSNYLLRTFHTASCQSWLLQHCSLHSSETSGTFRLCLAHSFCILCHVLLFAVPICVLCTCWRSALIPEAPSLHALLTLVANFKLVRVSLRCACRGLIMTNISVFELPPREYCNRYVS